MRIWVAAPRRAVRRRVSRNFPDGAALCAPWPPFKPPFLPGFLYPPGLGSQRIPERGARWGWGGVGGAPVSGIPA